MFPVTLALLSVERAQPEARLRPQPAVVTLRGARSTLEQVNHVVAYVQMGAEMEPGSSFL